jgi:hypothetical protein
MTKTSAEFPCLRCAATIHWREVHRTEGGDARYIATCDKCRRRQWLLLPAQGMAKQDFENADVALPWWVVVLTFSFLALFVIALLAGRR